jgi:hypothetical protein
MVLSLLLNPVAWKSFHLFFQHGKISDYLVFDNNKMN